MLKKALTLILIVFLPQILKGQIKPREGSELNYRLIGFTFPAEMKALNYTLEIANGNYNSEDLFNRNILIKQVSDSNKMIAEVPAFGSQYTWRVIYTFKKSSKTISTLFHFSTGSIPEVDTSVTRLKVTQAALKFKDAYVFLDDNKTLYDMTGKPVWYLPKIEGRSITPRNMKISRQGTITFMYDPPYEISYDGDILWHPVATASVSSDNSEHFHHQFTRLSNGHYMVLGEDSVLWQRHLQSIKDNHTGEQKSDNEMDASNRKVQFGTLIEYDAKGNVVWSWKSSDYFAKSSLKYFAQSQWQDIDVHENAFHFDEKNKNIYISFKNVSLVLKVKYPEGNVIKAYGETGNDSHLFCGQHSVKQTHDGDLILFNNNSCTPGSCPKVEILREPLAEGDTMTKIWEYECKSDLNFSCGFPSGGNVIELPDHSVFVSTAAPDSRVFIVSKEKEVLWNALPQRWDKLQNRWMPIAEYRGSIIKNRQELEHLIWGEDIRETK